MDIEKLKWRKTPNNILEEHVNLLRPGSVLDLGGSDGVNSEFLAQKGFNVTNVDIDQAALDALKSRTNQVSNICTLQADLNEYEPTGLYDNILTFYALHYLKKLNGLNLLERIKIHTAQNGVNIVVGFTTTGEFPKNPTLCYLENGQLIEIYKDWEIIYNSKFTASTKSGLNQERECVIARKVA